MYIIKVYTIYAELGKILYLSYIVQLDIRMYKKIYVMLRKGGQADYILLFVILKTQ